MRVLTVHQPWAAQLVTGAKAVEWRPWATAHRGRLAIHAAAAGAPEGDGLAAVRGAVIGEVRLLAVEWRDGAWAWVVADPIVYDRPIIARGRLGLWLWAPPDRPRDPTTLGDAPP